MQRDLLQQTFVPNVVRKPVLPETKKMVGFVCPVSSKPANVSRDVANYHGTTELNFKSSPRLNPNVVIPESNQTFEDPQAGDVVRCLEA